IVKRLTPGGDGLEVEEVDLLHQEVGATGAAMGAAAAMTKPPDDDQGEVVVPCQPAPGPDVAAMDAPCEGKPDSGAGTPAGCDWPAGVAAMTTGCGTAQGGRTDTGGCEQGGTDIVAMVAPCQQDGGVLVNVAPPDLPLSEEEGGGCQAPPLGPFD